MKKLFYLIVLITITMISCKNAELTNEQANVEVTENLAQDSQNDAINCILSRRSIRAYTAEQIKAEELDQILNCAINAPSARNLQPWELRVIQNKEVIDGLNKAAIADMIEKNPDAAERFADENASIFFNAPTLILIAYDSANYWGMSDCGMLAQNILLAAEALNIGTCAVGCCREYLASEKAADFIKSLDLPENYVVYLGVTLGYKDQAPEAKPRKTEKIKYIN